LESCSFRGSITTSDIIEYLYCPRFTYFMHCLEIPQREERLYKVRKGRDVHSTKEKTNIGYLRRRYGVVDKRVEVYMNSTSLRVRGIVDEVLFLEDGSAAPLDYKFAEYRGRVFKTHRYQSALYALMIKDTFNTSVNRGFIIYTRSNDKLVEVEYTEKDWEQAISIVDRIFRLIQEGEYPEASGNKQKCLNCTYRRICTR